MEYTQKVGNVLPIALHNTNIYHGREGALRLAREYGYGLNDSPYHEAKEALQASYGIICVKGYNLKPPIDAKEWVNAAMSKMKHEELIRE
jgi:hypothetical protein